MRVDLSNSAAANLASELSSQQVAANRQTEANQASEEDRATLSADSTSVGALVSKALESPAVRQDKVSSLRDAVNSGQYKIDPNAIAGSIVDESA